MIYASYLNDTFYDEVHFSCDLSSGDYVLVLWVDFKLKHSN
jgi:hypothetical protein